VTGGVVVIVLAMCGLPILAGADVAAKKSPRATINNPCTLLTIKQVQKQFGGPIAPPTLDQVYLSCHYLVGTNPAVAGGTLSVVQLFPNYLQKSSSTAKSAFEDEHAIDMLSNNILADVNGVGRDAYMNLTKGTLVVLATKNFLITLSWAPTPARKLNARDIRKLKALAKIAVPRSPRWRAH
jgi:hypothetical protein